jgi:hypothetical protein
MPHAPGDPLAATPLKRDPWSAAAVVVLVVAAAALTCKYVWNFDIFTHLACGRWTLRHGRVLDFDPFSVEGVRRWVNVHWLFQVAAAALHAIGGFWILTVLKTALAVGCAAALAAALRRDVPPAWLILSGLLMLVTMADRVRARPEGFALLFLMLIVVLLDQVRRGRPPRRLWWLAPIMLMWVNMHGLFILGPALMWSGVLGEWIDRRLRGEASAGRLLRAEAIAALLTATAVCLLTPWPWGTLRQPFVLWTRISGQAAYYTYGVSELLPTWTVPGSFPEAIAMVVLTAAVMIINARRAPAAHVIWMVAFVTVAVLAQRNVGLAAPVWGYLLAWHGGAVCRRVARASRRLGRLRGVAAAAMILVAAAVSFAGATELLAWWRRSGIRTGAGLLAHNYPIDAARFLRDVPAGGDVFCDDFGDAGPFIYYCGSGADPRRVWMDGRLEAHPLERFVSQEKLSERLRTTESAETVEVHESLRFFFVGHGSHERLSAMSHSRRFRVLHVGASGVLFARMDWRGGPAAWRDEDRLPIAAGSSGAAETNLADYDRPLSPEGGLGPLALPRRTWYRRNPAPVYYRFGNMLLALGRQEASRGRPRPSPFQRRCVLLAVRYLEAARRAGVAPRSYVLGTLAQAYQQWFLPDRLTPGDALPIDLHAARALHLYNQLDLTDLGSDEMQMFALQRILAMQQAGQLDAAARAAGELLENLPPAQQIRPPRDYLNVRDDLARAMKMVTSRIGDPEPPPEVLASPQFGLIGRAIAALEGEWSLRLGDLLLRKGLAAGAADVYDHVQIPSGDQWKLMLRYLLCDWTRGRLWKSADGLARLAGSCGQPVVRYYAAAAFEVLGRYDRALRAITPARPQDEQLRHLTDELRLRLQTATGG